MSDCTGRGMRRGRGSRGPRRARGAQRVRGTPRALEYSRATGPAEPEAPAEVPRSLGEELKLVREAKAADRKRSASLSTAQKAELLALKEKEQLGRLLLPNAPEKNQKRKLSPPRIEVILVPGTPSSLPPRVLQSWEPYSFSGGAIGVVPLVDDCIPAPSTKNDLQFEDAIFDPKLEKECAGDNSGTDTEDDAIGAPNCLGLETARDREASNFPANIDTFPLNIQSHIEKMDRAEDSAVKRISGACDLVHFNWVNEPEVFKGKREVFTGEAGPTFALRDSPLEVFEKIWDEAIINMIVKQTNLYAHQHISPSLKSQSRMNKWHDVTGDDIWTFFAVIMLQSLIILPVEAEYWHHSLPNLAPPIFREIISMKKFLLLKKCLHFVDNNTITKSNSQKLQKIQPIIDHLNKKFSSLYLPEQNISIDESLLLWKGRLSFAQLIKNKAAMVGIKSYELCESRTGYLWNMAIYSGKDGDHQELYQGHEDDDRLIEPEEAVSQIVFNLVRPLLNKGHTLVMDNFYNSPLLSRTLKGQQTDTMGTLRLNREFVPEGIKAISKMNMRHGEVAFTQTEDLSILVWRDTNLVSLLSTFHKPEVGGKVNPHGVYKYKPQVVLDYNLSMGGIDKKDQFLSAYPVERTRNAIWYKKLFRRLLNVSIHNTWVIHSHERTPIHYRKFRVMLAEQILRKYRGVLPSQIPAQITVVNTAEKGSRKPKLLNGHFPEKNETGKKRCKMCASRKVDKRTTFRCDICKVDLCINECFKLYHTT